MKAIIPVAGAGTKLRPHTYTQPKALMPLAGKTVLGIIVDQLVEAGIDEYILVVGYLGDKIQDFMKKNYGHLKTHFIHQNERNGLGHAVHLCKEAVANDEIMIVLGDTICEYNIQEFLHEKGSVLAVKRVDDPRDFGVAESDEENNVTKLIEKPQIPKSNNALVGIYKVSDSELLFECLEQINTDKDDCNTELGLTLALDCMISKGAKFKTFKVSNWFDCGKKETMLESNATLLKKWGSQISNDHVFENTIIIPPVSIGVGCAIRNAIIGPHVSIGDNASIEYSIVKESVVGSFAKLYDVVLHDSLIGCDTEIKGETRTLNIGDDTEIDLG